jgi:hypothetical protein
MVGTRLVSGLYRVRCWRAVVVRLCVGVYKLQQRLGASIMHRSPQLVEPNDFNQKAGGSWSNDPKLFRFIERYVAFETLSSHIVSRGELSGSNFSTKDSIRNVDRLHGSPFRNHGCTVGPSRGVSPIAAYFFQWEDLKPRKRKLYITRRHGNVLREKLGRSQVLC